MTGKKAPYFQRILALLLAIGLFVPMIAVAQEASPEAGLGEAITFKTRDEVNAELKAAFPNDEQPATTDGTYVVGSTSDLQGLNPFLAESDPSLTVVGLIYEGIVGGDPRTGEVVAGGLTDSFEVAADGVTYTFHLSKTATWSDGVDVTSADVIFSLDALADDATGSAYTGSFNDTVASYAAIDDDTFQIVAKEVRYTFLYDIQTLWVLPQHIWGEVAHADWAQDPGNTGEDPSRVVGTGPFLLQSWSPLQEIRLTRNDNYHDQENLPKYKDYVFRIFADGEAQFNAFLNGEIDSTGLEPEQVATLEGSEDLSYLSYPERGFGYYEFNLNTDVITLFEDVRVRQAFFYALDRQSIIDNIRLGYGEVANGTQPSISPGYAPEEITTKYSYDPEKAKALLAEAGWTDTDGDGVVDKDGVKMSFEFLYGSGSATLDSMIAYFQDAWKAVGIEIQPKSLEFSALIEATTTNLDWAMAWYNFSWDATFIQDAMFGCDQYQVGFNDMKYCNPELDEIFAATKREFDAEKRRDLLIQAANIVNDEQPVGIVYFDVGISAWNDRVHNVHPSAWGNQSYVGIWIDE